MENDDVWPEPHPTPQPRSWDIPRWVKTVYPVKQSHNYEPGIILNSRKKDGKWLTMFPKTNAEASELFLSQRILRFISCIIIKPKYIGIWILYNQTCSVISALQRLQQPQVWVWPLYHCNCGPASYRPITAKLPKLLFLLRGHFKLQPLSESR